MSNPNALLALGALAHLDSHRPNLVAGAFRRAWAEFRARNAARAVETLSDASLHDIGITRSEIDSAVRYGRYHRF